MKNLICYSILFSILLNNNIKAQEADTRKSFLLTGVSVNIPKGNNLSVYGGVSTSEEHTQMSMVMPNIKLNKFFTFTPLYIFLKSPIHGRDIKNHQINAMLTFSLPIDKQNKWILQNRNSYLFKSTEGGDDSSFYRGRLGIVHRTKISDKNVNFSAHDKIFIDIKNGGLSQNRVYLTADVKLFNWLNPQFFYIYQHYKNNISPNNHLFVIAAVIPLGNHGFWNSKK